MCILFHDWRVVEVINTAHGETIFGNEVTVYTVKQECFDCKKLKFEKFNNYDGNKFLECQYIASKQKTNRT